MKLLVHNQISVAFFINNTGNDIVAYKLLEMGLTDQSADYFFSECQGNYDLISFDLLLAIIVSQYTYNQDYYVK